MLSPNNQIKQLQSRPNSNPKRIVSSASQIPEGSKQFTVLQLDQSSLDRCLHILEWRHKTFLPIVKPLSFRLNSPSPLAQQKHPTIPNRFLHHFHKMTPGTPKINIPNMDQTQQAHQNAKCEVRVEIQGIKYLLSDINLLPLPQIIYLMKEMMIGYEVLVDFFGIFDPTDSMIAVNSADQWKLWVNSNFTLNAMPEPTISYKEFIYKLIVIAEAHCLKTTLSKRFFNEVKETTQNQDCSFVKIMEKTKSFASEHKVYPTNQVTLFNHHIQKQQEKTLKKQKGFHRIQQMKSSFIDGKFFPRETWTIHSQRGVSICSIDQQNSSPIKKDSVQSSNAFEDLKNLSQIQNWKSENQVCQFFTPRGRHNANGMELYSPQIHSDIQNINQKMLHRCVNIPHLNFTTADSVIEKRRSQQAKNYSMRLQQVKGKINQEIEEQNCRYNIKEDLKDDLGNSNSTSTRMMDSQKITTYRNLKQNDHEMVSKGRNNQSSFINITLPNYRQRNSNKNLAASYQFFNSNKQPRKAEDQLQPLASKLWTNKLLGLFSETCTIPSRSKPPRKRYRNGNTPLTQTWRFWAKWAEMLMTALIKKNKQIKVKLLIFLSQMTLNFGRICACPETPKKIPS